MSNPFKPITISLLPNFSFSDVLMSKWLLIQPWKYHNPKAEEELMEKIKIELGVKHCLLFESGRAAEYFLLRALGIRTNDEVIIQAFTCVAVPNSILWNDATPFIVISTTL